MNRDLLVRSLNYHGQQLTSFLQETGPKILIPDDLKQIDYHLYQNRSRELRIEDRGKRLLLHRFIAQNVEGIFDKRNAHSGWKREEENLDVHSIDEVPPLDTFLPDMSLDSRSIHFFDLVESGDIIFCRIGAKNMSGLLLTVQGFHPRCKGRKSRFCEDLRIKCFCPSAEMIPSSSTSNSKGYESGDYVCVVILEVKKIQQRLLVSMKKENLREELQNEVKLGSLSVSELPANLMSAKDAIERKIPYEIFMTKSQSFANPSCVSHLADELGLSTKSSSLIGSLRCHLPKKDCAPALRQKQNAKWAFNHVASGIRYFKEGNNIEAFQCLNQALKIDPLNVEGLVARGALYANNGSLEKAVVDFEEALNINSKHKNAKKYLCETLIALSRIHEDEGKTDLALMSYERVINLNPDSQEAIEACAKLKRKLMGEPEPAKLDIEDKVELLLGKKMKSKKKRRSSSSNSSSDSGDDDKSKRKERSLSPFSQKLAIASQMPMLGSTGPVMDIIQPPGEEGPGFVLPPQVATGVMGYPPPGFPMYPGYPPPMAYGVPSQATSSSAYDKAVEDFLRQTGQPSSSSKTKSSRQRSPERSARKRPRSKERSRKDSESRKREESRKKRKSEERKKKRRESSSPETKSSKTKKAKSREHKSPDDKKKKRRSSSPDDKKKKRRSSSPDDKKKKRKTEEGEFSKKSMEELVKMGFKENMDVDLFAKKLTTYLSSGTDKVKEELLAETSKKKEKEKKVEGRTEICVEGLDIVVKDLKKVEEKKKKKTSTSPPPPAIKRVGSPGVLAVFDVSDSSGDDNDSKNKTEGTSSLWKPIGSGQEKKKKYDKEKVSNKIQVRLDRYSEKEKEEEEEKKRKRKFEEKTSLLYPNMEFVVELDKTSGMYKRKFKNEEQKNEVKEVKRIIRRFSESPPRPPPVPSTSRLEQTMKDRDLRYALEQKNKLRPRSRSREFKEQRSRSREFRERRSRSREFKERRSRSRDRRSRSRDYRRSSRSRSPRSRDYRRSRSRERPGQRHDNRRSQYQNSNRYQMDRSHDRILDIQGMMTESMELQKEREHIEKEKAEILAQQREMERIEFPKPVPVTEKPRYSSAGGSSSATRIPDKRELEGKWGNDNDKYMDNVMDSVLEAVGGGKGKEEERSSKPIIPGARSFEDLEKILEAERKKKRAEMKQRNKGFIRPTYN